MYKLKYADYSPYHAWHISIHIFFNDCMQISGAFLNHMHAISKYTKHIKATKSWKCIDWTCSGRRTIIICISNFHAQGCIRMSRMNFILMFPQKRSMLKRAAAASRAKCHKATWKIQAENFYNSVLCKLDSNKTVDLQNIHREELGVMVYCNWMLDSWPGVLIWLASTVRIQVRFCRDALQAETKIQVWALSFLVRAWSHVDATQFLSVIRFECGMSWARSVFRPMGTTQVNN